MAERRRARYLHHGRRSYTDHLSPQLCLGRSKEGGMRGDVAAAWSLPKTARPTLPSLLLTDVDYFLWLCVTTDLYSGSLSTPAGNLSRYHGGGECGGLGEAVWLVSESVWPCYRDADTRPGHGSYTSTPAPLTCNWNNNRRRHPAVLTAQD